MYIKRDPRRYCVFTSNYPFIDNDGYIADIFAADGIIFDLEDAVVVSEKDAALSLLDQYLSTFNLSNLEVIVRVNSLDTAFSLEELDVMINDRIDTIMLPKATFQDTLSFSKLIDKVSSHKNLKKEIQIIPIIESAQSVIEVSQIASISRVSGLLLGGEDLATDLEVERTEQGLEILLSRSMVVLAAKANRIDAIDTPYTNTKDEDGLRSDSKFAKSLGMNAKVCIHPNQIDTVNEVFSPSQTEIDGAQKIIKVLKNLIKSYERYFSKKNCSRYASLRKGI